MIACEEAWSDAVYFATISATTIGYGDLTPSGDEWKAASIVLLPMAVAALANMLAEFGRIGVRKKIRACNRHVTAM